MSYFQTTRRGFLATGAAACLAGCSGGFPGPAGDVAVTRPSVTPVANPAFDTWLAAFRPRAVAAGVNPATLDEAFAGVGFLPDVVERDRNQAEVQRSLEDYLALAVDEDRITNGRAEFARQRGTLAEIEARYGVESHVVTAIWGIESRYGARRGDIPVISALATLAFDGRRGQFFEAQLIAALKILQNGDTTADRMLGSWAGAMGHTQFIPTSYEAFAVDFRGDGRRDIWSEDPTDALASAAAYLQNAGWRQGVPWGFEVRLPAGFDTAQAGRGRTRAHAAWVSQGVTRVNGAALPDYGPGAILLPAGAQGPAFWISNNFAVIARYNNSEKYVIAVGHLSDRIAGGGPIVGRFPPDEAGLSLADRQEIQRLLARAGFDPGGTDGVIGRNSIAAIEAYQSARGLPVTGEATRALLTLLRG
ncbi:MAG: lytic murein transglycosylase [Pseudomonadota bacterium]